MNQSISSLIFAVAAATAFTNAAASDLINIGTNSPASSEAKRAASAPAPNEPEVEAEIELMASDPDLLNRPGR